MKTEISEKKLPFVEKYRPKSIKEMVGIPSNIEKIKKFLERFNLKLKNGNLSEKDRAILLEGPPGVGKTTVVHAIANDLGYTVVEMNASDVRTAAAIKKKLNETVSSANLLTFMKPKTYSRANGRKKIILIDEVDGISGQSDRGGLLALTNIIKKTKNPIIMTSNFYENKLSTIYKKYDKIKFGVLRKPSILNILKKITAFEDLKTDIKTLTKITENCGGDLRAAINDLEGFTRGIVNPDDWDTIDMHRDTQEKVFDFINEMFKRKSLLGAKQVADRADLDYNILHKIVYANLSSFVSDTKDMAMALINLAEADKIMGRIRKDMDWSFLPFFFDLCSGGVVLSVEFPNLHGYKRFNFPRFPKRLRFSEDPVAIELQKHFFVSRYDSILKIIPSIKEIINNLPKSEEKRFREKLAAELGISNGNLKKAIN
ncbi:MAG: replication factor C large subunit [Promethearchaeota archaeon]